MSGENRHRSGTNSPAWQGPLARYDSNLFGPLFAVSDEGSAGPAIVGAAYQSAKARAFAAAGPDVVGVALDGERMTSAGEVPIGPDEYECLLEAARHRLYCTTNVGVRANARLLQPLPEFEVAANVTSDPAWINRIVAAFTPFIQTPDSRPRPLTVRLAVKPDAPQGDIEGAVRAIETARAAGRIGPAHLHRISALVVFENEIATAAQTDQVARVIGIARQAGIEEVAVDGELLSGARQRLGVQSLLNVLRVDDLRGLLREARRQKVRLTYRYQLDVESAARTIWTGLFTARAHGFSAGKYGLMPMALDDQRTTIELVTEWMRGWSAIPAFYVDTPLVTESDVYDSSRCAEAARLWLNAARGAGAELVLFDSPDRIVPRRLVRNVKVSNDPGVLTMEEIEGLLEYSRDLGVSILWSGGITSDQAFDLAKRRVAGIFSTSSTAVKSAVTAQFERDPRLQAENEPTELGVRRMHAIVQGGYLSSALTDQSRDAAKIEALTRALIAVEGSGPRVEEALAALDEALVRGWKTRGAQGASVAVSAPSGSRRQEDPVPADAVRVFRGRRLSTLPHDEFVSQLATVFMPMTVQMQRLYGLTAYLPAVLPAGSGPDCPDEVALVFYRTQRSYHEAKRRIGGRAYSELHALVFDMADSASGFPVPFEGQVQIDRPYHLWAKSIDWQAGAAHLYVGRRKGAIAPEQLSGEVASIAAALQKNPGGLDAVIFCVQSSSVIWWEHAPQTIAPVARFAHVTDTVLDRPARRLRIPGSLSLPYAGLQLEPSGAFLSAHFPRV
jgi:hypothetical protein